MPRYIDVEKIDFRLPYFTDENGETFVPLNTVKKCIAMTPTAEVAPKNVIIDEFTVKLHEVFKLGWLEPEYAHYIVDKIAKEMKEGAE